MLVCPECGTVLDDERLKYPIPPCCQDFLLREDEMAYEGGEYFDYDEDDYYEDRYDDEEDNA